MHTAQGLGTIAAMRSVIVLGPECPDRGRSRARPRVAQTKDTVTIKNNTPMCAQCIPVLAQRVGWKGRQQGIQSAHPAIWAQGMCAPRKRTHPPTTFEELLRAWAWGTIAAMRSVIVLGPECPDRSRSRARPRVAQTKDTVSIKNNTPMCAQCIPIFFFKNLPKSF